MKRILTPTHTKVINFNNNKNNSTDFATLPHNLINAKKTAWPDDEHSCCSHGFAHSILKKSNRKQSEKV